MVTDLAGESKTRPFSHTLRHRAQETGSWLCIGLDPQVDRLPAGLPRNPAGIVTFCREIIAATAQVATAYKINFAFFEALGDEGWRALHTVRACIPTGIPVVADAKRGDIGSTSAAYALAIFDQLSFDAVTVNPYLGWDALQPFAGYPGRCLFVLCRTSNPGADAIQALQVDGEPLFLRVAHQALALKWSTEIGLVVGATRSADLLAVRSRFPHAVLLVPGIGAQGAAAPETMGALSAGGSANALITVSRDILYASSGADFAAAAQRRAAELAGLLQSGHGDSPVPAR